VPPWPCPPSDRNTPRDHKAGSDRPASEPRPPESSPAPPRNRRAETDTWRPDCSRAAVPARRTRSPPGTMATLVANSATACCPSSFPDHRQMAGKREDERAVEPIRRRSPVFPRLKLRLGASGRRRDALLGSLQQLLEFLAIPEHLQVVVF